MFYDAAPERNKHSPSAHALRRKRLKLKSAIMIDQNILLCGAVLFSHHRETFVEFSGAQRVPFHKATCHRTDMTSLIFAISCHEVNTASRAGEHRDTGRIWFAVLT
ncbi:hypothetical protein BgiBS90_010897, partial [Biomphalaria glabrata]